MRLYKKVFEEKRISFVKREHTNEVPLLHSRIFLVFDCEWSDYLP